MAKRSEKNSDIPDRDWRAATSLPETWNEDTRSIEIVFSTGARVTKYDSRRGVPWIEDLPLRGMDVSELNAGAHVLRAHGLDPKTGEGLDAVIGSVVPGTAIVVSGTEARARITLSRTPGKSDVVQDIRDGVIRKWSYGYRRIGRPTITTDPDTGFEVRSWAKHIPDEISAVALPADGGTNTRNSDNPSKEDISMENNQDTRKALEAPAPDNTALEAAREEGRKAEATRQDTIRKLAAKVRLGDEDIRAMLTDQNVTVEMAQTKMLELIAKRDEASPTHAGHAAITRDADETRAQAMIEGLAYRAWAQGKPSDLARPYVNCSVLDIARECLEARGVRTKGLAASDVFDQAIFGRRDGGMASTSDFPAILSGVVHKNFLNAYSQESRNFDELAIRRVIADFKPVREIKMSSFSVLDQIPEGGEIKFGVLGEGQETWGLASYAKGFRITRQALINDDMGVFGQIPARMGSAVIRLEKNLFWALWTSNPKLADGKEVFHSSHKNITASGGGAPDVDQIAKGRVLLRQQTDLAGNFLDLVPTHIITGTAHETAIDKLMTLIFPVQASGVTPTFIRSLQPIVEPRLDGDTVWYLLAKSYPSLVIGYLSGGEQPRFMSRESWEYQGLEFKVEHDFGCAWTDHRGVYRNKGAA
jgi:hypothetical protein